MLLSPLQVARFSGEAAWFDDEISDKFQTTCEDVVCSGLVPVSDVVANFKSLATTFLNDELPLLGYFESTWIGQSVGGRRLPPMFSHHMWNVLDRAETGSTRATNALESFHHSYNYLLSCTYPAVWKLLESLEAQQNQNRSRMLGISRGDTFKVSAINRRRNERIMNLISHYTLANAMDFLRGIGYNYLI